ncbi:MAG TPA: metal-dependent hydrolase [Thermomicrobiales bacterium]|jgi:L-ascorbate metabolism protein UlaG (beta-lactamase superfamily)|nr:metal-dependent hydrolase [Thermomicrobiales bacterium]
MVSITWVGHGTWYLDADGHGVLVDPFVDSNPSATRKNTDLTPDTILLTHAHGDHVADVVDIAKRSGATVYAIVELAGWVQKQGVENTVGFNMGGTVWFPGGSAKMTPAWHSSVTPDGAVSTPPAGFVVRFGGRTIYFAGDTALFGDMRLIGEEGLDIAVLPIGDHFTMGPEDAVKAAEMLGAPVILPGHYNTFPPIQQDVAAFADAVASRTSSRVEIFQPGETREL